MDPTSSASSITDTTQSFQTGTTQNKKEKVWHVAKQIFTVLLAATLFIINPHLFWAGFIIGMIASDKISEAVGTISRVWNKQPWFGCALLGFAAYIAGPVTLAASTFLYAAHLGSQLEKASR